MLELYPSGMPTLRPLGVDGIKFVQSRLDDAAQGLAKALCQLPLSNGAAYAIVPETATLERIKQFEYGGLVRGGAEGLAEHVLNLNSKHTNGIFIFQDLWGPSPTDRNLEKIESQMFFAEDVYLAVPHSQMNQNAIVQAVKDIRGFWELGAFTTTAKNLIGQTLDADEFRLLAENAQEIYVEAYDGESYVIWKKSPD